jgi:hypothetical protein
MRRDNKDSKARIKKRKRKKDIKGRQNKQNRKGGHKDKE